MLEYFDADLCGLVYAITTNETIPPYVLSGFPSIPSIMRCKGFGETTVGRRWNNVKLWLGIVDYWSKVLLFHKKKEKRLGWFVRSEVV